MKRLLALWLFALSGASIDAAPDAALVRSEFIHEPGSYPQCHASTLAETTDGALVAAWFGGTHEKNPDVCIWLSRYEHGRWSDEVRVADGVQHDAKRYPCWNPVLFQSRRGPLLLFYKVGPSPSDWWGMVTISEDGGRTWSEPRRLPEDVLGPIKNKPVELADGTLLCGSSTEDPVHGWRVHLERTADLGRTWRVSEPLATPEGIHAIQPSILTHADGRLQLVCRSREKVLATSWSADGGLTWSPLAPTGIHAPNSGTDAVTLADGRQLLVYNHRDPAPKRASGTQASEEAASDWGVRWPLNVAISADGVTWTMVATLEDRPLQDGYAYPAVIQTRDGLVHITYTWGRVKIKHVVLDPRRL